MSIEEYKATADRAMQSWNAGDLEGYLQMYDPNVVLHGYQGVEPGFQNVRGFYQAFWAAFPGSQLIFEDVFGVGDEVAIRFVVRAIHAGDFQGIAATGKRVSIPGITIVRFAGGKCVERWSQADFLGLLQQLGAIPTPGAD